MTRGYTYRIKLIDACNTYWVSYLFVMFRIKETLSIFLLTKYFFSVQLVNFTPIVFDVHIDLNKWLGVGGDKVVCLETRTLLTCLLGKKSNLGPLLYFKPIVLSLGIIFCLAPTLCQFHYSRWRHIGLFIARPGYSSLTQQNTPALQATDMAQCSLALAERNVWLFMGGRVAEWLGCWTLSPWVPGSNTHM